MPSSFSHTARSYVSNLLRGSRSACFVALLSVCALGLLAMFFPQTVPLSGLELGLCVLVLMLLVRDFCRQRAFKLRCDDASQAQQQASTEQELRRNQQRFLSMLMHEIRTPLAAS